MSRRPLIVNLPRNTAVFPLGVLPSRAAPLLTFPHGLSIPSEKNAGFAVVGDGEGRRRLVETLLAKNRFHPHVPAPGPFPLLSHLPPSSPLPIRHLQFSRPSPSGQFTDFTSRYGSLHESDRTTLVSFFHSAIDPPPSDDTIARTAARMRIEHLLDLPLVGLSSGQTRRSRIAAGLMTGARMLILEDPFAGLDVGSRAEIGRLLGEVNDGEWGLGGGDDNLMKILLVLRGKQVVPDWVTDVIDVQEGDVWVGKKEEWIAKGTRSYAGVTLDQEQLKEATHSPPPQQPKAVEPIVAMKGISVAYGSTPILRSISFNILPSSRWLLSGTNGSGKTTLLSVLLGHHPRSFSLPAEALTIFGKPRREIPTPILKRKIGHTSPEVYAAFPRGMGLSAGEVVGTGYEGVFSRRKLSPEQKQRIEALLEPFVEILAPAARRTEGATPMIKIFETDFAHFPPPHQALLLFLRSLVSRPELLVLDEASQGMDEATWALCRRLLEREWAEIKVAGGEQAVVVVSHWVEEVPWEVEKGEGEILKLVDGVVVVDTSIGLKED